MLPALIIAFLAITRLNAFEVLKIDPNFFSDLFIEYKSYYTIRSGYPESILYSPDLANERDFNVTAYFEEQCTLDCLKNIFCIRYAFNEAKFVCTLRLHAFIPRRFEYDDRTANRLKQMNLDLQVCSNGVFCTDAGLPFCDESTSTGRECQNKITYELSEWSEWTPCSATCGSSSTKRTRTCSRTYFDVEKNETITEKIENNDWLCNKDGDKLYSTVEVKYCSLPACSLYSNWADWSSCSRICEGQQTRTRDCLLDPTHMYCDKDYVNEIKFCGQRDCSTVALSTSICSITNIQPQNIMKNILL
jgi:hypothetical protein